MDGIINFLKPPGMTSSDAVLFVRRLLPRKTAVGHGGTLDPDAAGVLPICVGRATRLFDYIIDKHKTYIGELCIGAQTDTCDATGRVVARSNVQVDERAIADALPAFVGEIMQTPPAYSALKLGGKRMCDLARKGVEVAPAPRLVRVYGIEYLACTGEDRHLLSIECGKGVYIRSLMRDIALAAGSVGHMSFLLRSRAGALCVESARTPEELHDMGAERALLPIDAMLGAYPRVDVDPARTKYVLNGMPILPEWQMGAKIAPGTLVRAYVSGAFAGMGETDARGGVTLRAMLLRAEDIALERNFKST